MELIFYCGDGTAMPRTKKRAKHIVKSVYSDAFKEFRYVCYMSVVLAFCCCFFASLSLRFVVIVGIMLIIVTIHSTEPLQFVEKKYSIQHIIPSVTMKHLHV